MKQALIFRKDLKLSPGKLVAQGAHAAIIAMLEAARFSPRTCDKWMREGMTKIVLAVEEEKDLLTLCAQAKERGLSIGLVQDAGKTEVEPGTVTCLAIGPGEVDSLTGALPLWKEEVEV